MKKTSFLFLILVLSGSLISCQAKATQPSVQQYKEEKINRSDVSDSMRYGEQISSYLTATGQFYALYCLEKSGSRIYTVTESSLNLSDSSVIPLELDETISYHFIYATTSGDILLADTSTLYVFPHDTQTSSINFPVWAPGGLLPTNDHSIICQASPDSSYYQFNLTSGSNLGVFLEKEFLFAHGSCQPFLSGTYGQELLFAREGIYEHIADSWLLRVPARGTHMVKSGFTPVKIERLIDGGFQISDSNYSYIYTAEENSAKKAEPSITIRVTAWQDRYTLKTALDQYQVDHPNIIIDYTFRCCNLPETRQDANILLQQTNSELISRDAADLYVLDCLPWEEYRDKGYLMDLSEIIAPYKRRDDYFQNIITAYETEEGLYAIPWFFSTKYILCKKDLVPYVQNLQDLASYLDANPESNGLVPFLYRDNPSLFMAMMYDYYGESLYDEGEFTQENVEQFLRAIKLIYDRQQKNPSATLKKSQQKIYSYSHLQQYPCIDALTYLLNGEADFEFLLTTPMGISDFLWLDCISDFVLVPKEGIHSQFLFGIHSQSKQKEATADLLSYLLSYFENTGTADRSLEQFGFLPGLPIYQPLLTESLEKDLSYAEEQASIYSSFGKETSPSLNGVETIVESLEGFTTPSPPADTICNDVYSILSERGLGYLTGECTLKEATADVYNGLMLWNQEHQ